MSEPKPGPKPKAVDPILRNAIRYTVSPGEYAALHKYILSRSRTLRKAAPTPASVRGRSGSAAAVTAGAAAAAPGSKGAEKAGSAAPAAAPAGDDFNARAVRHALRVFAVTFLGMKGFEVVSRRLKGGAE